MPDQKLYHKLKLTVILSSLIVRDVLAVKQSRKYQPSGNARRRNFPAQLDVLLKMGQLVKEKTF